jgi:hypothetical protein
VGAAYVTAVSAVVVAIIGVLGNVWAKRHQSAGEVEDAADELAADLNVIRSLSLLLEQERAARIRAERRLAACEAREQARGF